MILNLSPTYPAFPQMLSTADLISKTQGPAGYALWLFPAIRSFNLSHLFKVENTPMEL